MSGRQSLAGAFAPAAAPARGAKLEGLLAPKRRGSGSQPPEAKAPEPAAPEESVTPVRETVVVPPESVPEVEQAPTVEQAPPEVGERVEPKPEPTPAAAQAPKAAPRQPAVKKASAPAVKASETVPGALRNVGVYLPPALLAEVKDAVYQGRATYADLLIDAFETLTNEQIAGEFASAAATTGTGMPRRAPRKRGEAGIQIQLRLDGHQIAWLDGKVTEFDAPSRSALVSAVFKLHIQAVHAAGE